MMKLRKKLIAKLREIPDVDVHLWKPDYHLVVIDYKGREIAHFHGNNELDVRLSKDIVKRDELTHAVDRVGHLSRKNGGRWLIVRFTREPHLEKMVRFVEMAIEVRVCESA